MLPWIFCGQKTVRCEIQAFAGTSLKTWHSTCRGSILNLALMGSPIWIQCEQLFSTYKAWVPRLQAWPTSRDSHVRFVWLANVNMTHQVTEIRTYSWNHSMGEGRVVETVDKHLVLLKAKLSLQRHYQCRDSKQSPRFRKVASWFYTKLRYTLAWHHLPLHCFHESFILFYLMN